MKTKPEDIIGKQPTINPPTPGPAYDILVGDIVTQFDISNDPSLNCSIETISTTTHDSFYQLSIEEPPVLTKKASLDSKPKQLEVVKIMSSAASEETSAQPADGIPLPKNDDAEESEGILRGILTRANSVDSSTSHRDYSTDKPHNFSLQASPVRKEDTTLNSLDCSFDDDVYLNESTIDADKSAATAGQESDKWINFGESTPFGQSNDGPESTEISTLSHMNTQDGDEAAFPPSVFVGLDKIDSAKSSGDDANANDALIRQLEDLTNRLVSLERIVRGMDYSFYPMRVSDSTSDSDQSLRNDQAQDVAFIVESNEVTQTSSTANEKFTCNANDSTKATNGSSKSKGTKFSLKRMFKSRFAGNQSERKPAIAAKSKRQNIEPFWG